MIHNHPFLSLIVIMLAMPILVSCTTAPPPDTTADDIQAINAIRMQWIDAFNQGDAATVAALYTEEAKRLPPNGQMIVGRESIQADLQSNIDAGVGNIQVTVLELSVNGDMALDVGEYALTIQPEEGEAISDNGKFVVILKRDVGTWKLDVHIWNSSVPLPVPEALPTAEEE